MSAPHPSFHVLDRASAPDGGMSWHLRHMLVAEVVLDHLPSAAPFVALTLPTLPPDDSGVAHVLEHMIFRGARSAPVADLYAQLMLGGPLLDLNASTRADHTTFHATSATEPGRDEVLDILAEAIFAPLLDSRDLAEERHVVRNEMEGYWSDPVRAAPEGLRPRLFPGTAQARAYGGLPDVIAGLSAEALQAFHQQHYRPALARIYLTTQGDPRPVLTRLDRLLSLPLQGHPAQGAAIDPTPFAVPMPLPLAWCCRASAGALPRTPRFWPTCWRRACRVPTAPWPAPDTPRRSARSALTRQCRSAGDLSRHRSGLCHGLDEDP
jgi:hypothetical protein